MYSIVLLGLLGLSAAQQSTSLPTVPAITNNQPGVTYGAEFDGSEGAGIKGYVTISSNVNGTGTVINVNLGDLPSQSPGGPFLYHIHTHPVAANGSCATALAHLDPANRGESPPCDPSNPSSCQAGDLAGKFGKMTTSPWQQVYVDLFTSTTPGDPAFVGNRSIVIHDLNTTRIACANIKLLSSSGSASPDCSAAASVASTAIAPYPTGSGVSGGVAGGVAAPSGSAVAPASGSSSSSGASSGSGSFSGASSSASGNTGPAPSKSASPVTTANGAGAVGMSLSALGLAVLAFIL